MRLGSSYPKTRKCTASSSTPLSSQVEDLLLAAVEARRRVAAFAAQALEVGGGGGGGVGIGQITNLVLLLVVVGPGADGARALVRAL